MPICRRLAAVASVCGLSFAATGPARAAPLTLEVGAWPPFIDFQESDRGALSHIISAAFAKAGIETRIVETSWKAAEARLDAGRTLSFGWLQNPERQKRWRFSPPVCANQSVLIRRTDRKPLARLDELRGQRIGWSRGYSYGESFDRWRAQVEVEEMPTDEVGLRHLLNGTIDFMPMDALVARTLIAQKFSTEDGARLVVDTSPANVIASSALHVVCGLADPACADILTRFREGLRQMRASERVPPCGFEAP